MHARHPIPDALAGLASAQAGALSVEQCRLLGMPRASVRRLVREGRWASAGRGLLVTCPGTESSSTRHWLAVLAAGPGSALTLDTAARLDGWGRPGDEVHVMIPADRRSIPPGPWSVLRTRLPFTTRGTLPRTTTQRTCLELCRRDPDQMVAHVTDAVNSRRTTAGQIRRELELFGSFPRRRFLLGLLDDTDEGAMSVLENMWLRDVERAHGLPRGERQTRSRAGVRDVRYGRLLVELDGRLGHVGRGAFRDMWRDNVHLLHGELTMRFGFHDVDQRACASAAMVAAALRQQGMVLDPISCSRGCVEAESLRGLAA